MRARVSGAALRPRRSDTGTARVWNDVTARQLTADDATLSSSVTRHVALHHHPRLPRQRLHLHLSHFDAEVMYSPPFVCLLSVSRQDNSKRYRWIFQKIGEQIELRVTE